MRAYFKTWISIPLSALVFACGSSDGSSQVPASGDTITGSGTTAGSGSSTVATGSTGVGSGGSGSDIGTPAGTGTTTGGSGPTTTGVTTGGGTATGAGGSGFGGGGGSSGVGGAGGGPPPGPVIQPGILTAGVWDDNRNFSRFMSYRSTLQAQQLPGLLPIADANHAAAHDASLVAPGPRTTLDISFVIDTTGSMGDEIAYLKSEFLAISNTVKNNYPNAAPRWSLVLYRDVGDEYLVRPFDFSPDAQVFQNNLAAQNAGGGGDFPESPERGLGAMTQLAWRADAATARIAFWVADAPHHDQNAPAMAAAIGQARAQGIHIYPVASSGIDEFTELTMRTAAQVTLGRYLFLTNDSGVGGPHKEPSIPCYFVTKLDSAILRMVDIELTGAYHEPAPAEIIRTGGNPQNGACKLDSGAEVFVF